MDVKYNVTYSFEVFVPFACCTNNVPGVERDETEDECAFTKLDGVVPTRYEFIIDIDDVVLHEFVLLELEFMR